MAKQVKKLTIGAPSLTGVDANDLVAASFNDGNFPVVLKFTNLVHHALSFPTVGLALQPINGVAEIEIKSFSSMQRLASDIEQVAEINRHKAMIEIEFSVDVADEIPPANDVPPVTDAPPVGKAKLKKEGV